MRRGQRRHPCIVLIFSLLAVSSSLTAALIKGPELSASLLEKLRQLPYSVSQKNSLLLKRRHIDSVTFSGGAYLSRFGYTFLGEPYSGQLWLQLKNRQGSWSAGVINLKRPLNLARYNSVVLWVRTRPAGQKLWISLQDSTWENDDVPQARTDILPPRGFPPNEVLQLVLPSRAIRSEEELDSSNVSRIGFEFGSQTVGNKDGAEIEILGIAFVAQVPPVDTPSLFAVDKPQVNLYKPLSAMTFARASEEGMVEEANPLPIRKVRAGKRTGPKKIYPTFGVETAAATHEQKPLAVPVALVAPAAPAASAIAAAPATPAKLPAPAKLAASAKPVALAEPIVLTKPSAMKEPSVPAKPAFVAPVTLQKPAAPGAAAMALPPAPLEAKKDSVSNVVDNLLKGKTMAWNTVVAGWTNVKGLVKRNTGKVLAVMPSRRNLREGFRSVDWRLSDTERWWLLIVALLLMEWLLRREQLVKAHPLVLGKTLYEADWKKPFRARAFWKEVALKEEPQAWASPFQAPIEKPEGSDEYYGEGFLFRQIQLARRAGVQLIPSLCFCRTVFHYEMFLRQPKLYLLRQVASPDRHLSDEELRIKNIGFFPVWVPPFYQKHYSMPERVLAAYGKLPGLMPSGDSIQFHLSAPELRGYAIRLLNRFGAVASGARIEGAAALLSANVRKYWKGSIPSLRHSPKTEFWAEVIGAVKAKHPHFVFVADSAGVDAPRLEELGFSFSENNGLRDRLLNQIRLETVGNAAQALEFESAKALNKSIHRLTPLFTGDQLGQWGAKQNLLCSLLLCLLPGVISHDGRTPADVSRFLKLVTRWPAIRRGPMTVLSASSPAVLGLARWEQRSLFLVAANFSLTSQECSIRLESLLHAFDLKKLYLFSDLLYGTPLHREIPTKTSGKPVVTVTGDDLKEAGFSVSLAPLSLKIYSVEATRPIQYEPLPEIRKLYQT
ncbi:MAG: hypothetical protein LHV69_08595 [Elusimicrobia bacterium]|nr:hypothetical protein [Candidatus Obscuribacterium magneticum]